MKKLLFLLLFGVVPSANAQIFFDGKDLSEYEIDNYLVVTPSLKIGELTINLDENRLFNPSKLTDGSGKVLKFNSISHFLSYMFKCNWELVEITNNSEGSIRLYIFKKIENNRP